MRAAINVSTISGLLLSLVAASSSAIELIENQRDSGRFYGRFTADYINNDDISELTDSLSRIGVKFTRKLDNQWLAYAGAEWGLDIIDTDGSLALSGDSLRAADDQDESIWQRLGYVGLSHPKWGKFSVGKQWSTYYDVTKFTDVMNTFSGRASGTFNFGTDGGVSGTGRAEQVLQWRNQFNKFEVSAQVQATDDVINVEDNDLDIAGEGELDTSIGASVIYNINPLAKIGLAINFADYKFTDNSGENITIDDKIWALGGYYGQFDSGLYAALVYSQSQAHEIDNLGHLIDAKGLEAYLRYTFTNRYSVYLGYNHLQEDDQEYGEQLGQDYELKFTVLGVAYQWAEDFKLYSEYKFESSSLAFAASATQTVAQPDNTLSLGLSFEF